MVYKYTCDCKQVYVGQTKRRLDTRISEHQTKKDSAILKHVLECKTALENYTNSQYQSSIDDETTQLSLNDAFIYKDPDILAKLLIDRDKFSIVGARLGHGNARLRYETMFIRYHTVNAKSAMNECEASKSLAFF